MPEKPCDMKISVVPRSPPVGGSGTRSSGATSEIFSRFPVAHVLRCQDVGDSVMMFEIYPTVYHKDMEVKVGYDFDNEAVVVCFLYSREVMSARPAELGGQQRFADRLKEYLGNGWGEGDDLPAGRFQAIQRIDVLSHLNTNDTLLLRDPIEGRTPVKITKVEDENVYVIEFFFQREPSRQGIVLMPV